MALIDILLIVLILSASSLCIFLIVYLKRFFEQFEEVCEDIHQLVDNTIPILNNLEEVTQRANRIVTEVESYWDVIDDSIRTLREKISNSGLWNKLRDTQSQTSWLIKQSRSIVKGVSIFWNKYKAN